MKLATLTLILAVSNLAGQVTQAPAQTIRIEPVDATRVRLRLEGKESWVVDSASFNLVPDGTGRLRVHGARGSNIIRTANPSLAETFELTIEPSGSLGFHITNSKRLP